MQYIVPEAERKRAKAPHELFIINLFAFHLLLAPAAIALNIGFWALLLPVILSGSVISFIAWRAGRPADHWFVPAHWRLALRRGFFLIGGYTGSALVLGIAYLAATFVSDPRMQKILLEALTRIAIMPTFLMVLVTVFLEAGALNQALRGELPDGFARKVAPDNAVVSE